MEERNQVNRYFKETYPRRLSELQKELEPIATKLFVSFVKNDVENGTKLINEYKSIVQKFGENTKFHVVHLNPRTPKYINKVSVEYIGQSLGDTDAGRVFFLLYKRKE